jgi:phage tail sheath protein FI
VRTQVGAFLHELFRAGAFQGRTPGEAYLVKCGEDTMTQGDVDDGRLALLVGFAAVKPAEFVILRIEKPLAT